LALFHTLFNTLGVVLFLPWYRTLVKQLETWIPDTHEPVVLITEVGKTASITLEQTRARYLDENALGSAEAAVQAVAHELQHLARLSLEVICHALYLPIDQLRSAQINPLSVQQTAHTHDHRLDADTLYQQHIKGVYGDLLDYMGRLETHLDETQTHNWIACQRVAMQLVDAVKDAKHLQKNLGRSLADPSPAVASSYAELRLYMLWVLREVRAISLLDLPESALTARLQMFDAEAAKFDGAFREKLFEAVRNKQLDGLRASSLMNDVGYASRITQSLRNVLMLGLGEARQLLPELPFRHDEESPLLRL
jgi:phosphate:Na+ symporter